MPTRTIRLATVLLLGSLLAACGFQLRGVGDSATVIPDSWKKMHLETGNPNAELSRVVASRFAASGVEWTGRSGANYTLQLGPERFRQRNLSLNSEARAAEFELTMSADFTVLGADRGEVMAVTTASVVKQMENDPRNVVGKSEEVRLLRNEMRAELAQQIMRRIGFFATSDGAGQPVDPTGAVTTDVLGEDSDEGSSEDTSEDMSEDVSEVLHRDGS